MKQTAGLNIGLWYIIHLYNALGSSSWIHTLSTRTLCTISRVTSRAHPLPRTQNSMGNKQQHTWLLVSHHGFRSFLSNRTNTLLASPTSGVQSHDTAIRCALQEMGSVLLTWHVGNGMETVETPFGGNMTVRLGSVKVVITADYLSDLFTRLPSTSTISSSTKIHHRLFQNCVN